MFNKKATDIDETQSSDGKKKAGKSLFSKKAEAKEPVTPEKRRRQLSWLCGGCAAIAVASLAFSAVEYTVAQDTVAKSTADMIEVVVPKEDIKAGTSITADMLTEQQVPKKYVPEDACTSKTQYDLVGKSPVGNLSKGVPISMGTVQGTSNPSSISLALSEGQVAKTFSLDAAASMSPLLKPGDYVTVTASFKGNGSGTIDTQNYENVKVLATDALLQSSSDSGSSSGSYSTVTLELTREQLTEITAADSISLSAQPLTENPDDDSDSDVAPQADQAATATEDSEEE